MAHLSFNKEPEHNTSVSLTKLDIVILLLLQIATAILLQVGGIPHVLFIAMFPLIAIRLSRVKQSGLFLTSWKVTFLVLFALLSTNLLLSDIHDLVEFTKSAANLATAVILFDVSVAYFVYLSRVHSKQQLAKFLTIVLIVLFVMEIVDIFFAGDVFRSMRSVIYGYSHDSLRQLEITTRDLQIAGFYRPVLLSLEPTYVALHVSYNIILISLLVRGIELTFLKRILLPFLFLGSGALTGSPIGLAAGLLGVFLCLPKRYFVPVCLILSPFIAFVLLNYVNIDFGYPFLSRIYAIVEGQDRSAINRIESLNTAMAVLRNYPLSGLGLGQYDTFYQVSTSTELLPQYSNNIRVHNGISSMIIFLGIPGLIYLFVIPGISSLGKELHLTSLSYGLFLFFLLSRSCLGVDFWLPLSPIIVFSAHHKLFRVRQSHSESVNPLRAL